MEKISLPVRIFAVVIVLVGLAGMLAMRTMGPSDEPIAIPAPVKTPATSPAASPAKSPAQPAKAAASAPTPAKPKPAGQPRRPADRLSRSSSTRRSGSTRSSSSRSSSPARASTSSPRPRPRPARSSAAPASWRSTSSTRASPASLLAKLTTVQDPSVIVVKRSGEVALELAGFVDRETVAQAAANASS